MPYSKSSFDHLNTFWLIQSQPGIALLLQRLINAHDTFTTSHIVKEQPIVRSLGNAK
ncbi:hypothetical protein CO2235_MP20046 [Cupriavidus oxalaticus]|uniref:Uncharacterized protein n=1 Tax=Cupriavidus oxalaticus TaxID=96344 RepID=A0A375GGK2_9BURK|nr:hypothetical protein CO2235_MP20046 [Cupriavidus oxalaticus]